MKTLKSIFAALVIVSFASVSVSAQTSDNASAATSANIITPISIIKNASATNGGDLVFGNIVPTAAAGTVVIATTGVRSFTDGAYAFTNSTGNPSAAAFTVTGETDATFSIVVTNASFTVSNGTEEMTVNAITTSPTPTGVLTGGTQALTVGATLSVDAGQAAGLYTNDDSLEITVAYN